MSIRSLFALVPVCVFATACGGDAMPDPATAAGDAAKPKVPSADAAKDAAKDEAKPADDKGGDKAADEKKADDKK